MTLFSKSGTTPCWEKARSMQQKMVNTRSHVETRISELSKSELSQPPPRPPPPNNSSSQSMGPARPPPPKTAPPTYEDVVSGKHPSAPPPPPPYTQTREPYLDVRAQLDEIIDLTMDSPNSHSQSTSQMRRSSTSDSVGSSEEGEILFSLEEVQV